ncbi:MAG TPA: GNAT family protein [Thermoplasmata archaeon]|nr:GNAT family protein [Thermoplasmata archaeon]
MSVPDPALGIRVGRVSDCRALGALYASRSESDRALFHPFPGGRWLAPWVFFVLLVVQDLFPILVRLWPPWGFAFIVCPGTAPGTIDGFVYLRVRRRGPNGYVANIGTQVGPRARGKGVGPKMILALADEARRRGVAQIETQAYAWNASSLRMGEKLGFHEPSDPALAHQQTPRGEVITHVLDLVPVASPSAAAPTPSGVARPPTRLPTDRGSDIRLARLTDVRRLARLYASRDPSDRRLFHPFPDGRWIAPWVFLTLLLAQSLRRVLVRLRPAWAFAFVVYTGVDGRSIDGFVYLRVRRKTPQGYVANIGTQVGPRARGQGVGPRLIGALAIVARGDGIFRFETEAYEGNAASIRMCEKVGFRLVDEPPGFRIMNRYGPEVQLVMDLPPAAASAATAAAPPRSVSAATAAALLATFAILVILRLQILFSYPYPPGGDVAEQLYWSHIWLGTAFPSQVSPWWIPPVYLFTVYIPFTHLFPLFTGQRLLMGVVPALLLFPAYFLLRASEVNRPFSLFGAALLALAAPLSLMVTWNAGYNLFGMFCALIFFAGLVAALRTHRTRYVVVAALGFGLTAGAHDLTFAFLCLAFLVTALLAFALLPGRRATGRTLFWITLGGLICAAPFALVYLTLTAQTSNVGGAVTSSALNSLAQGLFPFVWGGGSVWNPLIEIDTLLSVLGILALLAARLRRPETPVLLGSLLSGALLSAAYPQLPERGLYFVPLGVYPMVAILFQVVYDFATGRAARPTPAPETASAPAPSVPGSSSTARRRPRARVVAAGGIAFVVMAVLLVANAQQSLSVMTSGEQFYDELSAEDLPALNWLAHNTSRDAAIYTPEAGLEKWIWGYANRQSYAPQPLSLQDTTLSYQATYLADLAALGQYVSTDPYLAVAQNSPAPVGTPMIYLHSEYYWTLLFNTAADNISLAVDVNGTVVQANLANAELLNSTTTTPCAGCTGEDLTFAWTGAPFTAREETNLSGETVSMFWTLSGATLEGVNLTTYVTPPDFGTIHAAMPRAVNASALTDHFSFGGAAFTVAFSGKSAAFSQIKMSDGWVEVECASQDLLRLTFKGLVPFGSAPAATVATSSIFSGLGISYILTNYYDSVPGFGYIVYLRCAAAGEVPGDTITEVFQSGGIYIFEIAPG